MRLFRDRTKPSKHRLGPLSRADVPSISKTTVKSGISTCQLRSGFHGVALRLIRITLDTQRLRTCLEALAKRRVRVVYIELIEAFRGAIYSPIIKLACLRVNFTF